MLHHPPAQRSVTVYCAVPGLERPLVSHLQAMGLHADPTASTTLLVDLPVGHALHVLERSDYQAARTVVMTENICPEYGDDLWSLEPAGLLVGMLNDRVLPDVLARVARGERYRQTPGHASYLTVTERMLLRALAHGWENRRIAQTFHLEDKTVRNTLTRIYAKLSVTNRVQAALYYWGRADLYG